MVDTDKSTWPKFRLVLDGVRADGMKEQGASLLQPFPDADACKTEVDYMLLVAGFVGMWRIEDEDGNVVASSEQEEQTREATVPRDAS